MLQTLFFVCMVFGGAIMVLQLLMALLGFDSTDGDATDAADLGDNSGDGETTTSHSGSALDILKVISFRTLVAGATFFGLGGMAGMTGMTSVHSPYREILSILIATAMGISAVYIVYYTYKWLYSLHFDGTVKESSLIGAKGTVYLKIPSGGESSGKVLVTQQDRTMEYVAVTKGEEIPTNTPITVVRILDSNTVEVQKM